MIGTRFIVALLSSLLAFATVADFANLETSVWMQAGGVITAHPISADPALVTPSANRPSWISAGAKQKPIPVFFELSSPAGLSSSRYTVRHNVVNRPDPGQFSVVKGRSPPYSTSRA